MTRGRPGCLRARVAAGKLALMERIGVPTKLGWCLAALLIVGCAAKGPIANPSQAVATPLRGQLNVSAQAGKPVGTVTPVYVSIANGTETSRTLVPSQIFALDDSGNRIA